MKQEAAFRRMARSVAVAVVVGVGLGFVPLLSLLTGSIPGMVTVTLMGLLGLVIVSGWAAFLITSAPAVAIDRWVGLIMLVVTMTGAVVLAFGYWFMGGWDVPDDWTWVTPVVGGLVVCGAVIGGLAGVMAPNHD